MNIELNIDSNSSGTKKSRPSAANILVLGDFAGQGQSEATPPVGREVRNMFTLDPNKLDSAIARVAPKIVLNPGTGPLTVPVTSMDSFHPDSLVHLEGLARSAPHVEPEPAQQAAPAREPGAADDDNDFARLLGAKTAGPGATSPAVKSTLDKLIADAVADEAPATVAPDNGLAGDYSMQLRDLLHAKPFQQLESTWRSLQWLGEHIDYDETASVWLVDVDLSAIESWSEDLLRKVAAGPGSAAAIVVLHDYAPSQQAELHALARLASNLKTIAFVGATHSLAGFEGDISKATALDASDFSKSGSESTAGLSGLQSVAAGYPGILLRQPYGKRSDPIDSFDFDELGSAPSHDAFAWGSASIVLTLMWLTATLVVDDAPLVTYDDGSGQAIKAPTGAYMTDSAAETLLARGIVPLLARRGGTEIRVPRLQSLAITAI